jgi:hypothetical protein
MTNEWADDDGGGGGGGFFFVAIVFSHCRCNGVFYSSEHMAIVVTSLK